MMPDGKPLMVMQGIMPQPIMGPEGKPAMGPDGKMLGALPVGPGQVCGKFEVDLVCEREEIPLMST